MGVKPRKRPAIDDGTTMRTVRQRTSVTGSDRDVAAAGSLSRGSDPALHDLEQPIGSDRNVADASSTFRGSKQAVRAARQWKPKTRHSLGPQGRCWSCVAGGFGKHSISGKAERCNACRSCLTDRSCGVCRVFNDNHDTFWCSRCGARVALWCERCDSAGVSHSMCREGWGNAMINGSAWCWKMK